MDIVVESERLHEFDESDVVVDRVAVVFGMDEGRLDGDLLLAALARAHSMIASANLHAAVSVATCRENDKKTFSVCFDFCLQKKIRKKNNNNNKNNTSNNKNSNSKKKNHHQRMDVPFVATYAKQWAALRIHCLSMIVPPQK